MKARRSLLAVLAAAAVSVCAAQDTGSKFASADTTYRYLTEVGRIRTQVNTDNKETIPALLQGQDPVALRDQAKKLDVYKQALDGIDPTDVDSEAVQFKANFSAIVDAYKSICVDSAELYKQVAAADAKPGASPMLHQQGARFQLMLNDTLGAVDSLIAIMAQVDPESNASRAALQPLVDKLHADEDTLRKAKDTHHDFTQKIKSEFTDRYQGTDWTNRDILP
jgi:hypothetical protein